MDEQKYLPADILVDVLCRLPVESLLRCRCVSKTWLQIIGTNSFINYHLNYQKTSSNTNKYILYDQYNSHSLLLDSDSINFYGPYYCKFKYTPELFGIDDEERVKIYGMCDGLLCLSESPYQTHIPIYLWNPLARKVKKLPKLEIPIKKGCSTPFAGLTFGYYEHDYKVLVIAAVGHIYFVSVYSLSTDSWKIIRTNFYSKKITSFKPHQPTRFVHGTAYMSSFSQTIVCFNLGDETICEMEIPLEFLLFCIEFSIEAYGDSIALFCCDSFYSRYLAVWVLRDKSSSSPWEKKFLIELQQVGRSNTLGFLSNGKYLIRTILFDQGVTKFFLCDLETKTFTEFSSHHGPYPDFNGFIYSDYVQTLVLLNENTLDPFLDTDLESDTASSSSTSFTSFLLYNKIEKEEEHKSKKRRNLSIC